MTTTTAIELVEADVARNIWIIKEHIVQMHDCYDPFDELHNPDEIPEFNFGNRAFDLGHEAAAEAGIAESELPARCIGDPYFMAGHAVGMAERNHAAVLRAVIPHHRNADALIDDLGGLESDTLAALAAALQVRP